MKTNLQTLKDWLPEVPINSGFREKLTGFEAELLERHKTEGKEVARFIREILGEE